MTETIPKETKPKNKVFDHRELALVTCEETGVMIILPLHHKHNCK